MSDLIKRLRMGTQVPEFELRQEAADEIERLQEVHKRDLAEYNRVAADVTRLRAALERYGHHLCTCSSLDKMDSGALFHRSDWPCDCGFKEAHREALDKLREVGDG